MDNIDNEYWLKKYVLPHDKLSRDVTVNDIDTVTKDAKILYMLCFIPNGLYPSGEAIAHSQINEDDPLKFFVTRDKEIIINPEIINHTKTPIEKMEGCMSFPWNEPTIVERWNKVTVRYVTLSPDPENKDKFILSDPIEENINGKRSEMFQHEISCHFFNKYLYPKEGRITLDDIKKIKK